MEALGDDPSRPIKNGRRFFGSVGLVRLIRPPALCNL